MTAAQISELAARLLQHAARTDDFADLNGADLAAVFISAAGTVDATLQAQAKRELIRSALKAPSPP